MILYWIPAIIIVASLSGMIYILLKKFPNLAAINIATMPKEKELKVKNRIMTERLARHYQAFLIFTTKLLAPVSQNFGVRFERLYQDIMELEKKIKPKPLKVIDVNQEVNEKLEMARNLLASQELEKAEEICIAIIELNPRNIDVYEILADVYLELKDYKEARETQRYLLRLLLARNGKESESSPEKHRLANAYSGLGWIYQSEARFIHALENYQKAITLEPSNPRFLDLLLKISIILKNKKLAFQAFNNLREADPDNQKLSELKEQINQLPENKVESKKQ